jgi:hypothetical protein
MQGFLTKMGGNEAVLEPLKPLGIGEKLNITNIAK